jgi:hypothetical protein
MFDPSAVPETRYLFTGTERTIVTALLVVVDGIAILPVISAGRGGHGAHLLLAVGGEGDLVHGGGLVAQRLRGRSACACPSALEW